MSAMLDALRTETNVTQTENGASAYLSTLDATLDFFAHGGALRNTSEETQVAMFSRAYGEDPWLAVRAMFYFRDIRGGQGVRISFQNQLKYLAGINPNIVRHVLPFIPEFGYWADLYSIFDSELQDDILYLMKNQLAEDLENLNAERPVSLLAKWLRSENASSKETKRQATIIRRYIGLTSEQYRKILSSLREHINVTERLMTAKKWDQVQYEKVPGKCLTKHKKAWMRNDKERYMLHMASAATGEIKVNTANMYPHEVVEKILAHSVSTDEAEAYWKNIRDFGFSDENSIVVADVSGSMDGTPLNVAISLALYISERNKGPYSNHFITFSSQPQLVKVIGNTIVEKVHNIHRAHWDMNTDIVAVFQMILDIAIKNKLPQEDLIHKIYIISDMEFDSAQDDEVPFDMLRNRYQAAGYNLPKIVFWNVDARNQQFPVTKDDQNVQLVSGFSPAILKHLQTGTFPSPVELMLEVLNSDRYMQLTPAFTK